MCGIAGIYCLDPQKRVDFALLREMTARITHRGPYDEGYLLAEGSQGSLHPYSGADTMPEIQATIPQYQGQSEGRIGLGFRRLPILELKACGHQPMCDDELGLAIVFNGEIYNYLELRADLITRGYNITTQSDTEVLLKAYHAWGEDFVQRLNGMWALGIWDSKQQRLFCSRDRFGIKPCYFAHSDGVLYFGSEIKQLLAAPLDKALNPAQIYRSMKINAMLAYGDETYWHAIRSLTPGCNLIANSQGIETKPYYRLNPETFERSTLSLDEAAEQYLSIFSEAVRLQLRSDVEIGSSLSGGLDSTAILAVAKDNLPYPIRSFSTYFSEDQALDERQWIAIAAEASGAHPHYIAPRAQDASDWWERATWLNDLPLAAGFVSQYALMQHVHNAGIRVLLSGQGSDEINAGYRHAAYRYYADLLHRGEAGKFLQDLPQVFAQGSIQGLADLGKSLLCAAVPESRLYGIELRHYRFEAFDSGFIRRAQQSSRMGILNNIQNLPTSKLSNFLYNMIYTTSLQTLLHFEDRMSMAHSVESRVPFLDHRLVELAFSLPASYKIKPPLRKLVHRQAIRGMVPEAIFNRKDKGIFSSPFYSTWMRHELRDYISDILSSTAFRQRGYWNLPLINSKWQAYLAGDAKPAEMLFNVIALEIWARIYT